MSYIDTLQRHQSLFANLGELEKDVTLLAEHIENCIKSGGKILFMGNGGSAADCQHLAAEFVVRYKAERQPIAAMALTVDSSILTAHANDYDFSSVFTRQVQAFCQPKDLVIGISTSGSSANVIDAIREARQIGACCWSWTGVKKGQLDDLSDHVIKVPCDETARIQEAHIFIGHWLCEEIDRRITES
ncbi:SIS domain-containing protein [Pontibacterium sp.]|uniref:D-sedoheptulose-7-phosphate isomerase n=1 Tax=Pontibacterium sp. TaxID=2036026 RepID=UPI003517FEBA